MENADTELAMVHRLTKAMNNAQSQSEHDSLKKSLGIANAALARKRARVINAQADKQFSSDFKQWQNVPRSTLTDEERVKILREYGRQNYLSMPV